MYVCLFIFIFENEIRLSEARIVAANLGHDSLLKWRSKAKKIIDEGLENALMQPDLSEEFKTRLRNLSRGVNMFNAERLSAELKEIHAEYLKVITIVHCFRQ